MGRLMLNVEVIAHVCEELQKSSAVARANVIGRVSSDDKITWYVADMVTASNGFPLRVPTSMRISFCPSCGEKLVVKFDL